MVMLAKIHESLFFGPEAVLKSYSQGEPKKGPEICPTPFLKVHQ